MAWELQLYLTLAYGFVTASLSFFAVWTWYGLKKTRDELSQAERNAGSDVP
ncbi:MAG: hypothetical protein ACRC12_02250 [Holosporales bacterium]|jgi:hypothetical protein